MYLYIYDIKSLRGRRFESCRCRFFFFFFVHINHHDYDDCSAGWGTYDGMGGQNGGFLLICCRCGVDM
jgi:hypothetical protein